MDGNFYGPALPPGFKENEDLDDSPAKPNVGDTSVLAISSSIIGPQLPPGLEDHRSTSRKSTDLAETLESGSLGAIGPALPPGFTPDQSAVYADSDSDSDSVYGPLPAESNYELDDGIIASIEKRATDMKKKLLNTDKPADTVAKREEWMTLPATDYKNQFGIISRCLVNDSQPKSSSKRPASKISSEDASCHVKDETLKKELEKYNKSKRSESLLELHRKSKKQKKDKESNKPKERKAFDRDAELGVRLMDQRQVNSVIRNAKKLNSRFASGASQYL